MCMRILLAVTVLASAAAGQPREIPGWFAASTAAGYSGGLDSQTRHGGQKSAFLRCAADRCPGLGGLIQTIRGGPYLGRRIRVSAWVKAANAGRANIWVRAEGAGAIVAFDDQKRHPARGTFGWRRQEVTVDVPDFASAISYGLVLEGGGQAWVDDFAFQAVGRANSRKVKGQPYPLKEVITQPKDAPMASEPSNTDFERW